MKCKLRHGIMYKNRWWECAKVGEADPFQWCPGVQDNQQGTQTEAQKTPHECKNTWPPSWTWEQLPQWGCGASIRGDSNSKPTWTWPWWDHGVVDDGLRRPHPEDPSSLSLSEIYRVTGALFECSTPLWKWQELCCLQLISESVFEGSSCKVNNSDTEL